MQKRHSYLIKGSGTSTSKQTETGATWIDPSGSCSLSMREAFDVLCPKARIFPSASAYTSPSQSRLSIRLSLLRVTEFRNGHRLITGQDGAATKAGDIAQPITTVPTFRFADTDARYVRVTVSGYTSALTSCKLGDISIYHDDGSITAGEATLYAPRSVIAIVFAPRIVHQARCGGFGLQRKRYRSRQRFFFVL